MAHLSQAVLEQKLSDAANVVTVGAIYIHYKDPTHTYSVIAFGIWEQDESVAVIYKALYGEQLTFIRPLSSWIQSVAVGEKSVPRFRLATDTEYN